MKLREIKYQIKIYATAYIQPIFTYNFWKFTQVVRFKIHVS